MGFPARASESEGGRRRMHGTGIGNLSIHEKAAGLYAEGVLLRLGMDICI